MPDTLRTRIAAVHQQHRLFSRMVGRKIDKQCLCGWRSPERDCTWTDHPDHLADVLIRELNLAKACDSGCVWQIPNHYEDMTLYQRELLKRTDDE